MKAKNLISGLMFLALALFNSCKKEDLPTYGKMKVRLTDAPALYQSVNVDIQKVSVHLVSDAGTDGWVDLPTISGVYDLLVLEDGIDTALVNESQLSTGKITQMRLLLGSDNTVELNNVVYKLMVPSGSESGIKLVGNLSVTQGQVLNVLLDFDADASIVATTHGTYELKPVIKVVQ